MRVAIFSTYPPTPCGIGTYTGYLRDGLAGNTNGDDDIDVTILAERTSDGAPREPHVIPCWNRKEDWSDDILAGVEKAQPDLVHVQHEEALLGQDGRIPELFGRLRTMGIRRVITLHSVYARGRGWLPGRWAPVRFQQVLGERSNRIVVHQHTGCRDRLRAQGVNNVEVIPHGTLLMDVPTQAQARAALGLPLDEHIALGLGFIHPRKGTHTIIRAFAKVARALPKSRLIIAGNPRLRNPVDRAYHLMIAALMRPGFRDGWMDYRPGFHDTETVKNLLAAADVVVFPYRQSYGSASGILHTALGAARPVLCARGLKFAEAHDAWGRQTPELFPAPGDVNHWAGVLVRVLSDQALRAQMSARSDELGKRTAWKVVAQQHLNLYRAAMAQPG